MDTEVKVALSLFAAFGLGVLVGYYLIPRPTSGGYEPLYVPTCDTF